VPPSIQILADTRARNAGSVRAAGLDYVITYAFTIGKAGAFNIGSSGTWYLNYKTAVVPGAPFVDLLGAIQYPNKFQARAYVGWKLDAFNILATVNHSNSYNNNLVTPVQKVSDYTTVDLHVGYDLSRFTPLSKLRASVDFTNIFDRAPPFVNIGPSNYSEGGFDTTQATPVGRVIAFTLTAAF
jgi:iron complex outermembrane receptor protein